MVMLIANLWTSVKNNYSSIYITPTTENQASIYLIE